MPVERTSPYCPSCGGQTELRALHGRERPLCTVCGEVVYFDPKVAVAVCLTRTHEHHEEILLIQRLFDPSKGLWALPAGFIEYDEAPEAAAIRETYEETGLHIHQLKLVNVLHRPDTNGMADIVMIYTGISDSWDCHAGDDAQAVNWFRADALPDIAFTSTQLVIDLWHSGKLRPNS